MVQYVTGDLFASPAQTLVNTVNTVGVMGKGVALRFKRIWPEMFAEYQRACEAGDLRIGTLQIYRTPHKLILNFPTKKHWRQPSREEYVTAGLQTLVNAYEKAGIHSIAFPPLGCGNGELDFSSVVQPIMHEYLADLPIQVLIYAPHERIAPPEHRIPVETREWLRSQPRDLPFREVWADLLQMLNQRRSFKTIVRAAPFEAWQADSTRIQIQAAGKTSSVLKEEFAELWTQLREFGILTREGVPANRDRDASYLLPLLAELPYVGVVASSKEYGSFSVNPSWGVQLLPAEQLHKEQLQLV